MAGLGGGRPIRQPGQTGNRERLHSVRRLWRFRLGTPFAMSCLEALKVRRMRFSKHSNQRNS